MLFPFKVKAKILMAQLKLKSELLLTVSEQGKKADVISDPESTFCPVLSCYTLVICERELEHLRS